MGSSSSGLVPFVLTMCVSLGGAHWHFSWTQVPFSLASYFFWSFSFMCFRKLPWLLRVFNMLNMHINSLGKHPVLNLFVYNNANSMLGNIIDSSSFPMVIFTGHSCFEQCHWCLQCYLSCRFTCMWPKEQLHIL